MSFFFGSPIFVSWNKKGLTSRKSDWFAPLRNFEVSTKLFGTLPNYSVHLIIVNPCRFID